MSGVPSLRHALGEVERAVLPPLVQLKETMPQKCYGAEFTQWLANRREVRSAAARALADLGGVIVERGDGEEWDIHLADIHVRSAYSLHTAVDRWRQVAWARVRDAEKTQ